jgi:hypothetical protein
VLTILEVFGGLEAALLVLSAAYFYRAQGMEIFAWIAVAVYGTAFLAAAFLLTVVVHDHVHLNVR